MNAEAAEDIKFADRRSQILCRLGVYPRFRSEAVSLYCGVRRGARRSFDFAIRGDVARKCGRGIGSFDGGASLGCGLAVVGVGKLATGVVSTDLVGCGANKQRSNQRARTEGTCDSRCIIFIGHTRIRRIKKSPREGRVQDFTTPRGKKRPLSNRSSVTG